LYTAWKQLIVAYLLSALVSFAIGMLLVKWGHVQPERLLEASTKRLSYLHPVVDHGTRLGVDMGVLLFVWNAFGALVTISFIHSAALFNPEHLESPPRWLRNIFCGRRRMQLLCYLPGCAKIEAEPLRRLYVWVMVPLLGIILLGVESGLMVSTTTCMSGSFLSAVITLLPHGLIELPAFTMAGAVAYSVHLCTAGSLRANQTDTVFRRIDSHRRSLAIKRIAVGVVGALLVAGLIEAHVTPRLMQIL
jgi:hypothetical protein